jgi:peptide chain release factor 2
VLREAEALREELTLWRHLEARANSSAELLDLAQEEEDQELLADVSKEAAELEGAYAEARRALLFGGQYDQRNAMLTNSAGAGGTEATDWAEMLLRMYLRWAERHRFGTEILDQTEGEETGIKSVTVAVDGRAAYGFLKAERGVHRLVRISPFDSQARRQTSFASMDVTPLLNDDAGEVEIDEKDLRVDTYRSSGAGGQHVNKTDSAIRLTHIPTNIVVSCQNERSQHQNRARAMQILEAKLAERQRAERQAQMDALSGNRGDNAWGSQIRSYVQAPYQLVKDHRTDFETGNVEAVLDGDLDEFMEAELRRQRSRS